MTALQREHPEWVTEVIEALGETTVVVPREHIVAAVLVSEDLARKRALIFWPIFVVSIAAVKKSRGSKSTIICFRRPSIIGCA